MARSSRRQKNNRVISLDFTNAGEAFFMPPEGDYQVEVKRVSKGESSNGNDQLEIDFEILAGKYKGKVFRQWYSLVEQALWRLSRELSSAGIEVPNEPADLDLDDVEGRKLSVTIEHREYNGDTKAQIAESSPLEEVDEDDEDDKKSSKSRKSKKDDDEDDEDDKKKLSKSKKGKKLPQLSGDEVSEMEEEDLEEVIEKYDLDVDLGEYKTLRKKAAAVIDALETAGHLESE